MHLLHWERNSVNPYRSALDIRRFPVKLEMESKTIWEEFKNWNFLLVITWASPQVPKAKTWIQVICLKSGPWMNKREVRHMRRGKEKAKIGCADGQTIGAWGSVLLWTLWNLIECSSELPTKKWEKWENLSIDSCPLSIKEGLLDVICQAILGCPELELRKGAFNFQADKEPLKKPVRLRSMRSQYLPWVLLYCIQTVLQGLQESLELRGQGAVQP